MNRLIKNTGLSLLLISLFLGSCASTYSAYSPGPQVQVGASISFYNELSPYGRWTSYQGYNQVWIPNAGRDFRPYYSDGHWVYTDYGWTWASDLPWGWAAFHYGRWMFDDYNGWMWLPGSEWGPAWVDWRSGGDYYGWAPMGPHGYYSQPNYWSFVPRQYINSPNIHNYYINNSRNVTIINNTTIINNSREITGSRSRVVTGPSVNDVQRYVSNPVRPVRITNTDRPGAGRIENNQMRIYRPDAAAIERGQRADNGRISNNNGNPVINNNNNNRPSRVDNGNNNNTNNNGGRIVPGRDFNNNNGNTNTLPNNNSNRPSRISNDRPNDIQQQQIQQQQRIQRDQQLQQIQQQQQQQRIQREQQQQQQRIQREQQQQQDQQRQQQEQQQRVQREQQQQQQRQQDQQRQQQEQQQRVQREQQQQQQRQQDQQRQQQEQQQRVQREQQQQQQQQQQEQQRPQRVDPPAGNGGSESGRVRRD